MSTFRVKGALLLFALFTLLLPTGAAAMNLADEEISNPDWIASQGWDVNERGDVVGFYIDAAGQKGFRYRSGTLMDIIPPGWTAALAFAISDNGNIAGAGSDGVGTKGFLYSGGSYTTVAPAGWTGVQLWSVNDSGQVAGFGSDGGVSKGILCNGGTCIPLLPLGWTSANCRALNSSGQVACFGNDGATAKGFLYDGGTYTEILPPGAASAQVFGLNDSAQVVGMGFDGVTNSCFVYDNGSYSVIPPPTGYLQIMCQTIDEHGAVAGFVVDSFGQYSIVIWDDGQYHFFDPPQRSIIVLPYGKMRNGHFTGLFITPGGQKTFAMRVSPAPDLKAGPYDGPGTVGQQASFSISASLSAGIFKGDQGEYWLLSQQPSGTWSYNAQSRSWQPGVFPAAAGPLKDLAGFNVFTTTGLPTGLHSFTLAVDRKINGVPDAADWDDDILYFFVR